MDRDWDILHGDALQVLRTLESENVHTVVTSPPYYGLRDYGVKGQLGLEATPAEYLVRMVEVFREVRRVLRPDGTAWVNMGDGYASGEVGRHDQKAGRHPTALRSVKGAGEPRQQRSRPASLKPKDLLGMPWRLALALQADSWYLRSDIIWHKPNPMPESVTDRPTKSHEYIFLLAKSQKYYYDADAVREPLAPGTLSSNGIGQDGRGYAAGARSITPADCGVRCFTGNMAEGARRSMNPAGRNRRTVWTIATQSFKGAHFATFPQKLVEPCILAGCPEGGLVLDPFCGSGTTGLVALQHGRRFLGIELNRDYITLAKRRIRAGLAKSKSLAA